MGNSRPFIRQSFTDLFSFKYLRCCLCLTLTLYFLSYSFTVVFPLSLLVLLPALLTVLMPGTKITAIAKTPNPYDTHTSFPFPYNIRPQRRSPFLPLSHVLLPNKTEKSHLSPFLTFLPASVITVTFPNVVL